MPHTQLPQFRLTRRHIIAAASTLVSTALIISGLAAGMPTIERQLRHWQLLPVSQKLTEFYLESAETLPKTYQPGQRLTPVVTITNRTGESRTYRYRVTQTDGTGQKSIQLLEDSITIAAGHNTSLHLGITPQDLGKRTNISIALVDEDLSLNYWLERE